jgi:hypothetical protein
MESEVTKQLITEESGVHRDWFVEAKSQTLETLPKFLRKLTEEYGHDYGTICHAISAAAVGAAWAVERSPAGGITGFQSGCVMWGFITEWLGEKGPQRLVNYNNLLYPQYADSFTSISADTWAYVQAQAKEHLSNERSAHENVAAHWRSIDAGVVPFGLTVKD